MSDVIPNSSEPKGRIDNFRIQSCHFMLTWPQCNKSKESVLTKAKDKWDKELKSMLVCEELHKDGTPHIHCSLNFYKKKSFRGCKCFNFLTDQQGNYQKTKSYFGCIYYVLKHGNYINYNLSDYEIEKAIEWGKRNTQLRDIIKKIVEEDKDYFYIRNEYKEFTFHNDKKLKTFINEEKVWKSQINRPKHNVIFSCIPHINNEKNNSDALKISNWLNNNINKSRQLKQKQLYLYGEKDIGKSTLVRFIRDYGFLPYMLPKEDYFDLYHDNMYDFIWAEEFVHSQIPLQTMNMLLEGDHMPLKVKGKQNIKYNNLPMIICSNILPKNCYPKCPQTARDAFFCRLEPIYLECHMNIIINKISDN